jgi:hypothetical protein
MQTELKGGLYKTIWGGVRSRREGNARRWICHFRARFNRLQEWHNGSVREATIPQLASFASYDLPYKIMRSGN